MLGAGLQEISSSPKTYSDWLHCFEVLRTRNVDRDTIQLLKTGECSDSAQSVEFLETQLVSTINAMIHRYLRAFNKEISFCMMYNEYDNFHRPFVTLANKLNGCMFFLSLDFMSREFRCELRDSVKSEVGKFWKETYNALYAQCVEQNDVYLEDELFLIKRIKLFRECECIEL